MSNLVFAHFFSANAKITRRMVVGSALVVGGTVLACVFGPSTVAEFEVQELVALASRVRLHQFLRVQHQRAAVELFRW